MWFKVITILALVTFTQGCTFSKKTPEEAKAEAVDDVTKKINGDNKEAAVVPNDITVSFIGLNEPNNYKFIVKLNKRVPLAVLQVNDTDGKGIYNTDMLELSFKESPDEAFNVTLKTYNSSGIKISDVALGGFRVPIDKVFKGVNHLYDRVSLNPQNEEFLYKKKKLSYKYSRIFFDKETEIYTYGNDIELEAEELISQDQVLISQYPDKKKGDKLLMQHEALIRGSDTFIKAKKITGEFYIKMLGVQGRRGVPASADFEKYIRVGGKQQLADELRGKNGVDGALGVAGLLKGSLDGGETGQLICERHPQNGEDGKDAPQLHGGPGGIGADIGDLIIDVEDFTAAKVLITHQGGLGGQGGSALLFNIDGGLPGKAGRNPGKPCKSARDGQPGQSFYAANSRAGDMGSSGKTGRLILPRGENLDKHFIIQTPVSR